VEEGYFLSALSAIRHSEYYYCWSELLINNKVKCRLHSVNTPTLENKIRGTCLHH
jgi:hypothetical protein